MTMLTAKAFVRFTKGELKTYRDYAWRQKHLYSNATLG